MYGPDTQTDAILPLGMVGISILGWVGDCRDGSLENYKLMQ